MKIKLIILITLIAIFPLSLFSQLSIQFTSINNYLFNTKEALNFIVINNGVKSVQVQFSGKIVKSDIGNVTLFKTEPLILNVGANIITPTSISLNEINYLDNDIREIEQKTGTYPSGNYTICIWSACTSPDCDGSGPSAGSIEQPICTNISIENPTPLLLSYPCNETEIEETKPVYTWIPPAPVASSASLNYKMTLVEIYDGQTKSDALAINRPLIEWTGISNPMLMHPSDLPALEGGKSYAWQVQAFVGQTYFATSEQWKFKLKKDTLNLKNVPRAQSYIEISGQTGASIFYAVGKLYLKNVVRLQSGIIKLNIMDNSGLAVDFSTNEFHIKPGDNRLIIDLESELKFIHGKTYTLTGKLLDGTVFKIRFIYIDPEKLN